ncbi:MAG: cysteine synthase A [Clostridia bacterium]|nr:cysteine synthase A [Clostridia bacterium]
MNVCKSVKELVGNTPMLECENYASTRELCAKLVVKLEGMNPAGSAKDRVALMMIADAEEKGLLKKGSCIIEPTSGNTGIGLAAIGARCGYRVILTMPDTMSVERQMLIRAYGAQIVLTEGAKGMSGAIEKANELAASIPNSFVAGQFENPSNPRAHYLTTGPEIWNGTDGSIDVFVASVGTGGTITGVGKYLKEKKSNIKVVAVEPEDSPVLSGGKAGAHKIQGIGAGFVPKNLDTEIYDEVVTASHLDAYKEAREFAKKEGILVGISSGAVLAAACKVASRKENAGKTVVALLTDSGERYLSTPLFCDEK